MYVIVIEIVFVQCTVSLKENVFKQHVHVNVVLKKPCIQND